MKPFNLFPRCFSLLTVALWAGTAGVGLATAHADDAAPNTNQVAGERLFASPGDAVTALRTATDAKDQAALTEIFGPDIKGLLTGDPVQDQHNARRFSQEMDQGCQQVSNEDGTITLEVGTNHWPLPIPLVKSGDQWFFDTAAGKDEIINRHVGRDELHAIGVCHAYVEAQKHHAAADPRGCYALFFASHPGTNDGLYWPADVSSPPSPFGPRVAEAQVGPKVQPPAGGPQPFHGYYFKVLTAQGPDAPDGKKCYLHHHHLAYGFALVAFPQHWDQSGVMTFIVNADGRVYQKNLGPETHRLVRKMKAYNPDETWTLVLDQGIVRAATEE